MACISPEQPHASKAPTPSSLQIHRCASSGSWERLLILNLLLHKKFSQALEVVRSLDNICCIMVGDWAQGLHKPRTKSSLRTWWGVCDLDGMSGNDFSHGLGVMPGTRLGNNMLVTRRELQSGTPLNPGTQCSFKLSCHVLDISITTYYDRIRWQAVQLSQMERFSLSVL